VGPRHPLDGLDREHQRNIVRVIWVLVPSRQARLLHAADDHFSLRDLDSSENVVVYGNSLCWLNTVERSSSREKLLAVKLEFSPRAVVGAMQPSSFANMLVEPADVSLVNRERENEVNWLRGIVALAPRVPRLVHVRKSHPRPPSGIAAFVWRLARSLDRMSLTPY
jgi:hypothetical protein